MLINVGAYAAAAGWFQIFDLAVAPTSTTTVPLKSINVAAAGMVNMATILSQVGPIPMHKGLFFAMSSTEAVYTAVATNFDVWGEIEESGDQLVGATVVGDLTTPIDVLNVWLTAAGPKKLLRVDILPDGLTDTRYLMLVEGIIGPTRVPDQSKPIRQWPLVDDNAVITTLNFGPDGIDVFAFRGNTPTLQQGCTLVLSDTPAILFYAGSLSGDTIKMRAFYK